MPEEKRVLIKHAGDKAEWESAERFGFPPEGPVCRVYDEGDVSGHMAIIGEMPAGFVEPRHVHDDVDHWSVIMDGEMHLEGEVLRAGDMLYAPRGVAHGPLSYPVRCRIFTIVRGDDFVHDFDSA